ncbi:MAG: hypothetical protein GX860_03185 [Alcaligenaceae bacterium]|nr:hypothetical protein [Alcaligenaceae bacterium]
MLSSLFSPKLVVVRLLNSLLKQEPWARERTQQFAGKIVKFQLPMTSLALVLNQNGTMELGDPSAVSNVTVTLASEQIPAIVKELSNSGIGTDGLDVKRFMSYVHIEGEAGLANLVSDLARELRWDRHYYLANLFGPVITAHLLRTERFVVEKGRENAENILRAGVDILSHEQEVLIAKVHFNDVNRMLSDLDSRMAQLEKAASLLAKQAPLGAKYV